MKIITYNVNGIRAAMRKGLMDWLKVTDPDLICFQEIKATPEQLELNLFEGYYHYWYPAEKKGYSGVAIFSKNEPDHVEYGCGIAEYDAEGRVIRADYGDLSVISVYMPSGTSGEIRQSFKMKWLDDFSKYIEELRKSRPRLIIAGDYNICPKAIDIHDPVRNAKTSGFLPEEREWVESFKGTGFIDSFRHFNEDPHHYTWWSQRPGVRDRNLGWRIDYQLVTENLREKLKRSVILPEAKHSDHCPVLLEIDH